VIGFAQLRRIGRDAACGAIERESEARYTCEVIARQLEAKAEIHSQYHHSVSVTCTPAWQRWYHRADTV